MFRIPFLLAGCISIFCFSQAPSQDKTDPSATKPEKMEKTPPSPPPITEKTEFAGKNLTQWIATIRDPDPSTRSVAMQIVSQYGKVARKPAVKYLLDATLERDSSLRLSAVQALAALQIEESYDVREVVKVATRLLSDSQAIVRYNAALLLAQHGAAAKDALPTLIKVSIDDQLSWEVRKAAAFALSKIAFDKTEGPNPAAILALAGRLRDACQPVRQEAVQALMVLGPPKNPADQLALRKILIERGTVEKDRSVLIWTRVCLMRLDPTMINEFNLGAITKYLKSRDPEARLNALHALGTLGTLAKAKVKDIIDVMKNEKQEELGLAIVATAAWALGEIGAPDAKPALPELQKLVTNKDELIRNTAADAIESITGKRPEVASTPKTDTTKTP